MTSAVTSERCETPERCQHGNIPLIKLATHLIASAGEKYGGPEKQYINDTFLWSLLRRLLT